MSTVNSQGVAVDALASLEESGMEITKSLGRCQSINRYPYQTVNSGLRTPSRENRGQVPELLKRPSRLLSSAAVFLRQTASRMASARE